MRIFALIFSCINAWVPGLAEEYDPVKDAKTLENIKNEQAINTVMYDQTSCKPDSPRCAWLSVAGSNEVIQTAKSCLNVCSNNDTTAKSCGSCLHDYYRSIAKKTSEAEKALYAHLTPKLRAPLQKQCRKDLSCLRKTLEKIHLRALDDEFELSVLLEQKKYSRIIEIGKKGAAKLPFYQEAVNKCLENPSSTEEQKAKCIHEQTSILKNDTAKASIALDRLRAINRARVLRQWCKNHLFKGTSTSDAEDYICNPPEDIKFTTDDSTLANIAYRPSRPDEIVRRSLDANTDPLPMGYDIILEEETVDPTGYDFPATCENQDSLNQLIALHNAEAACHKQKSSFPELARLAQYTYDITEKADLIPEVTREAQKELWNHYIKNFRIPPTSTGWELSDCGDESVKKYVLTKMRDQAGTSFVRKQKLEEFTANLGQCMSRVQGSGAYSKVFNSIKNQCETLNATQGAQKREINSAIASEDKAFRKAADDLRQVHRYLEYHKDLPSLFVVWDKEKCPNRDCVAFVKHVLKCEKSAAACGFIEPRRDGNGHIIWDATPQTRAVSEAVFQKLDLLNQKAEEEKNILSQFPELAARHGVNEQTRYYEIKNPDQWYPNHKSDYRSSALNAAQGHRLRLIYEQTCEPAGSDADDWEETHEDYVSSLMIEYPSLVNSIMRRPGNRALIPVACEMRRKALEDKAFWDKARGIGDAALLVGTVGATAATILYTGGAAAPIATGVLVGVSGTASVVGLTEAAYDSVMADAALQRADAAVVEGQATIFEGDAALDASKSADTALAMGTVGIGLDAFDLAGLLHQAARGKMAKGISSINEAPSLVTRVDIDSQLQRVSDASGAVQKVDREMAEKVASGAATKVEADLAKKRAIAQMDAEDKRLQVLLDTQEKQLAQPLSKMDKEMDALRKATKNLDKATQKNDTGMINRARKDLDDAEIALEKRVKELEGPTPKTENKKGYTLSHARGELEALAKAGNKKAKKLLKEMDQILEAQRATLSKIFPLINVADGPTLAVMADYYRGIGKAPIDQQDDLIDIGREAMSSCKPRK